MSLKVVDRRTLSRTDYEELFMRAKSRKLSRRSLILGAFAVTGGLALIKNATLARAQTVVFEQIFRREVLASCEFASEITWSQQSYSIEETCASTFEVMSIEESRTSQVGCTCYHPEILFWGTDFVPIDFEQQRQVITMQHEFKAEVAGGSEYWAVSRVEERSSSLVVVA